MARLMDALRARRRTGPRRAVIPLRRRDGAVSRLRLHQTPQDTRHANGAEYTPRPTFHAAVNSWRIIFRPRNGGVRSGRIPTLHFTRYELPTDRIRVDPQFRLIGNLLGSADILAQMADRSISKVLRQALSGVRLGRHSTSGRSERRRAGAFRVGGGLDLSDPVSITARTSACRWISAVLASTWRAFRRRKPVLQGARQEYRARTQDQRAGNFHAAAQTSRVRSASPD